MKTLKEQLTPQQWEEFKDEVRNYFYSPDVANEQIASARNSENARGIIQTAFDWHDSIKGRKYWMSVFCSLERK